MYIKKQHKRRKIIVIGVFIALLMGNLVHAQSLLLDSTVKVGELPNGFRYFIKTNKHPEKRAVLYLANKVGSILEEEHERGLAHFIEHMNFKGTRHFPKNQLIDYLEKAGVRFGADLNAYTSYDETVYQLPLPTDDTELWKNGMQIMRDWAAEAVMDKTEFEKERGVILEEKRLQHNASGRMRDQYMPTVYNFSRYAERSPIGLEEVIAKADIAVLKNFYKEWYRPDLQALIVVGDIDVQQVEHQIKTLFSDLKPRGGTMPRPVYTIPLIDSTRFIQVKDREFSNHQIEIVYKRNATAMTRKEEFKEALVEDISNSLAAARIQEVMREGSKPYLGISIGAGAFVSNLGAFNVRIALTPDKWEEGFKAAWTEVERMVRYGFTADELQDVKDRLLARIALQEKEKDKIASTRLVEDYLEYFLKGAAYLSIDQRISLSRELLETIGLEDVQHFIKGYLEEKDRVILVLATDKPGNQLPGQAQVLDWMSAVEASEIKAYQQDRTTVTLLENFAGKGKVVQESKINDLGLTHWTLSNGANVYAKPTVFKNDEVLFTAFSKGGSSLYTDSDYYSTMNASALIMNSGVGNFTLSQLSQFLNAKAVQVMPYIGEREEGLNGSSNIRDLETGLGLVHLYMTESKLDTARFGLIMERSKTAMQNRADDPRRVFSDTVGNILGSYHFRRQPNSIATIEQIKADRVEAIFKERFANAGDFTFVFVGNFELDSLKQLVEKYIGSLPSDSAREVAKDLKIRVPEGKIRKDLNLGQGDKATVQLVYSASFPYDSNNSLYLEALKSAIDYRLIERLRKQESGVYSPMVQLTKSKHPTEFFAIVISFDCDPDRKEELIKAVQEELTKLKNHGILQEELVKFVAEEARAIELKEKSNPFWLSYLKGQLEKGEPLDEFSKYPQLLKEVDLTTVNKAVRALLKLDNEIIVTLSPDKD
ncbi:M16 family metallopeptidase [Sphingobacterium alkalisoli]|nr:M16 family metallopeptidase [Sphingobacterium alkalisoli]